MDRQPPAKSFLRLAASRSDASIRQHEALQDIRLPLRELAANLMRVARGAGNAYLIEKQAIALVEALTEYRQSVGCGASDSALAEALTIGPDWDTLGECEAVEVDRSLAEWAIVKGSLQMAASDLLGQASQRSVGEKEMFQGLSTIERLGGVNTTQESTLPTA